ncbi:MAG: right-handed parallel beta-helix repeat-containing protein, partial [Deltaproteobacteria bacterium]|nr:right-handed parallel beta-helix repeat-containing protein [Deltaproteobacteria bacterium]
MWQKNALICFLVLFPLFTVLSNSEAAIEEESGTISAHTVWTNADVHLVTGNVTVNPGIELTIEPGTIVKFNPGTGISINEGILVAVGGVTSQIIFTSYRDDEFGGDTDGGGFSTGQPGDWARISLNSAYGDVDATYTSLENCIIRYGGSGNQGSIYLYNTDVPVISSEISYGISYGIYASNCSPLIQGNTISNNGSYGIYTYDGSSLIQGNTISNNGNYGIYHRGYYTLPSPVDLNNTITGNFGGIYVRYATPTI